MFDNLQERLGEVLGKLTRRGALSEADVTAALREVRIALLEADVALPVVKDFVEAVKEKALGEQVLRSVAPGQMVIKVVHDHLIEMLGAEAVPLDFDAPPPVAIMLVGLQGSGKTTSCAKIGLRLTERSKKKVLMASLDVRRPAAQEQLKVLGLQAGLRTLDIVPGEPPVAIAKRALQTGALEGFDVVLLDTAGRLAVDAEMMAEAAAVRDAAKPHETLLVADAMTGQDAVTVAASFHDKVGLTGIMLTRVDGDARGGAALSITRVTGIPIKFMGVGERPDGLEAYHPDRLASRILAMGDILTLIEKAQDAVDEKQAEEMEKKFRQASFDLEDFLIQIQSVKKMGSLSSVMDMIPGMGQLSKKMSVGDLDDGRMERIEAIIRSMTRQERQRPEILNGSRRRRISRGSGTTPADVNQLLNQFKQTQKMMKQMAKSRNPMAMMKMLKG